MNKKRVVIGSILALLILVGAYYVFGAHGKTLSTVVHGAGNASAGSVITNWTKGGTSFHVNFTMNMSSGSAGNITNVTVTVPENMTIETSGNLTFNGTSGKKHGNVTFWIQVASFNLTGDYRILEFQNTTGDGAWQKNQSFIVQLNVTTVNLTEGDNANLEKQMNVTIKTVDNDSAVTTTTWQTGIDNGGPRFVNMSFTYTNVSLGDTATIYQYDGMPENNTWIGNGSDLIINVTITDQHLANATDGKVRLCYNGTGGIPTGNSTNGTNLPNACLNGFNVTMTGIGAAGKIWNATIDQGNFTSAGEHQNFSFIFWANDSFGNARWINGSGTGAATAFNFSVDGTQPMASLTAPTSTTIGVQDPIKYTCGSTDLSGINCTMTVTKPDSSTITKSSCAEQTLENTDTNQAGIYTISCSVTNGAGSAASISSTFNVLYSAGAGGGGGGGGGGTGAVVVVFDVDFSQSGVESKTFTKGQGSVVDFSLDGTTKHNIAFTEVKSDQVTLTISSKPSTLTLKKGQSGEVDVNEDGKNDIEITLEDIIGSSAKITVDKLAGAAEAAKPTAEEKKEAEGKEPTPTAEPTSVAKPSSKSGLIIAIAIIIIGIVVYFVAFGKKK